MRGGAIGRPAPCAQASLLAFGAGLAGGFVEHVPVGAYPVREQPPALRPRQAAVPAGDAVGFGHARDPAPVGAHLAAVHAPFESAAGRVGQAFGAYRASFAHGLGDRVERLRVAGTVLELQRPQVVGPWLREVAAFAGLLPRLKTLPVPAHGRTTASADAPVFALRRPATSWVAWLRLSYAHTGHASCEMTPSMCSWHSEVRSSAAP